MIRTGRNAAIGLAAVTVLGAGLAAAPAPAARQAAAPMRRLVDVAIPLATGVPAELVPLKPGGTEKVAPATLQVKWKVGPLPPVGALCFSADGKKLFAGVYGRVSVWDLTTGGHAQRLAGVEGSVHELALSPDGKQLAVAGGKPGQTGVTTVYDAANPGQPLRKFGDHTDVVYGIAWSPDGKRLATASFDKTVKIWDVGTGAALVTVKDHSAAVLAVAFSPDGKLLASGGRDRSVKLFDAATGKSLRSLIGHTQDVHAIAFSADGGAVISSGVERPLRWWETTTGKSIRSQGGHGGGVYEIRRSVNGKQLLSVSGDQTARIWDSASGALQKTYSAVGDPLLAAALSPDGTRVAAGSVSGRIRLWDAASGRLLALAIERPDATPRVEALFTTPEGYVGGSDGVAAQLRWEVGGVEVPAAPFTAALVKPEEVLKALRGEPVTKVKLEVLK
ncbi:MAG: WD40 repeat domain-containing protein [Actinomycetota bacterium]